MRVVPDIVLSGFFWLPSNETRQVPGTVTVADGGNIRLSLLGTFEEALGLGTEVRSFERIVGKIEEYDFVTFEKCTGSNWNPGPEGVFKTEYHIHHAFFGVAFDQSEKPSFNSLRFTVDGLDEWHATTGLKVEYRLPTGASIDFERPAAKQLWADGDMTLNLEFGWTPPGKPALTTAALSQNSFLVLRSKTTRSLEEYLRVVHQLANFFALAIDQAVSISKVFVTSADLKEGSPLGREYDKNLPVYFPSISFIEEVPKPHAHTMLFTLRSFAEQSQSVFAAWFAAHERVMPGMNLFFSARAGPHKYLNSRFLWTAQALETYHRRSTKETAMPEEDFAKLKESLLGATPVEHRDFVNGRFQHANEPSNAKRLRLMMSAFASYFGDKKSQKDLVRAIVDTRNYFTHYDHSLEQLAAHGKDLFKLCMKMEALFQLHLLREIGFSDTMIESVVKGLSSLKQKLSQEEPPKAAI